jgi:large subunit ribosomal protein L25
MKLKAEIRTKKGKSGVRSLRREEKIPAILYGHGEESVLLQINEKDIRLMEGTEHFTIDFGKQMDVIIKDMQIHPTTSKILHIDFQHLHRGESVKIKVSVVIEGAEVIIKRGDIFEQILQEVEIECLPKDIPSEIKIDVSELKMGDSIHLNDLPPIKGKFITPLESTVVTVLSPKVIEEKLPDEEIPEGEEGEEGEKEGESKKEDEKGESEKKE